MSPFESYIDSIKSYPLLSEKDEIDLLYKIKSGDEEARNLFINSNLRLVVSVAKKFLKYKVDIMDIISCGNIGLINAVDNFNVDLNIKFSTYAYTCIKNSIIRNINLEFIKIPEYLKPIYYKYVSIKDNNYSDSELMEILQIDNKKLSILKKYYNLNPISIDNLVSEDNDTSLHEIIPDKYNSYDEIDSNIDLNILLYQLKIALSNYEYYIIYHRYINENNKTLEALADEFLVTRERIRQQENSTLKKLKYIINNSRKPNINFVNRNQLLPLSLEQKIILYSAKNSLTEDEYFAFYNIYLKILPLNKIITKLSIDVGEEEYYKIIISATKDIFNNYQKYKKILLKKYTYKQIMEFDVEPLLSYDLSCEFINNISYEDIVNNEEFYNMLDNNSKILLSKYFNVGLSDISYSRKDMNAVEKEINLRVMGYYKTNNKISRDILYKIYIENIGSFSIKHRAIIEYFIFNKISKDEFEELFGKDYNMNTLNVIKNYLYTKLEKIYFGIDNIFEKTVSSELVNNIICNYSEIFDQEQLQLLKLRYGIGYEKCYSISEIADMFNWSYIFTHDKLNNLKEKVLKQQLKFDKLSLDIDKDKYKEMIYNPSYDLTSLARDILYKFLILNISYDKLAKEYNFTLSRVSNIITDSIRKLDMYRYGILIGIRINKEDIEKYCSDNNLSLKESKVLEFKYLKGLKNNEIYDILGEFDGSVISNFIKYYKRKTSKIKLEKSDYIYEVTCHITDSVLSDDERKFISYYYGITCDYNPDGIKYTKNDIMDKFNINFSKATRILNNINLNIRQRKCNLLLPRYGIILKNELEEILKDSHLPITDKEKEILCYLKGIGEYKLLSEEEIAKKFDMNVNSLYRRYQRAILLIKKYQSGEIEGKYSYEDDIIPVLKYFSEYDRNLLYLLYFKKANSSDIAEDMNITRDTAFNDIRRVKYKLLSILNNDSIVRKFDFDYAREVLYKDDIQLYGNKDLLIQIYTLYFGENGYKRMSVPKIKSQLNLDSSDTSINDSVYIVMLAVLKYKMGFRREKTFTYEQVIEYYKKYKQNLSQSELKCFDSFLTKTKNRIKLYNQASELSNNLKYLLLKEYDELIFSFEKSSREDVIRILKDRHYNFSSRTKTILKKYYDISEREFMTSKEKLKVMRIFRNFYKYLISRDIKKKD